MTEKNEYESGSPTDKKKWLGFLTKEDALLHSELMNKSLEEFETSGTWNREYWKQKPDPWQVREIKR